MREVKGKQLTVSDGAVHPPADALLSPANNLKGLILSFAVLLGWATLLRTMWSGRTTWPESLALACLFFTLLVLPTHLFFYSAQQGLRVESFLPLAAAYTKNEGLLFTVFLDVLFLVGKNKQLKAATIYTLVFAGCSVGQFYWSKRHFELAFSKTAGLHHLGDVKGCAAMELYSL